MNTFYLLLIIYFLLFLFLSIKNIKWAIYLIIFTLPAYLIRFQIEPLPMTLLEGEILILFLAWLLSSPRKRGSSISRLPIKVGNDKSKVFLFSSIALFLIAATISMFISPNLRAAAGLWKAYFIEPILFLIVFVSVIKKEDLPKVLQCFSVSVLLLSLFAIYQKMTGVFILNEFWAAQATRRVTSVFPYPNALALYLAPIIILLVGWLVTRMQRKENVRKNITLLLYYFITIITGLLAIYFTKSKGALLAILIGIIFYALFYKGYRKIFIGLLIIIFISLYLYIFISDVNLTQLLKGDATIQGGDSLSTRLTMWQETWQMLKTKPLLGAGLAGYQTAVAPWHTKDYIEIYLYPHNIILNFWTEIGLLGLLAFALIVAWFYKSGFVTQAFRPDKLPITFMAAMTTLLIHGLVDVPYFKNDLSILFWIIIGSMIIIINNFKKYEQKNLQQISSRQNS